MADAQTRRRVESLRVEIEAHRYRYYVLSDPSVTDAGFDALMRELQELEAQHPELDHPDSPTHKVGAPPSGAFAEVAHRQPMLSLDNAFSREDLQRWADRNERMLEGTSLRYACELKIDGVAISVTYVDGRFDQAVTRGDGRMGENVTNNVRTITGIPAYLDIEDPPALVEARGEIYYPVAEFEAMNDARERDGQPRFANPRNAASGALRQKDPRKTAERPLRMICHGMGALDGLTVASHSEFLAWLDTVGLPVAEQTKTFETFDDVWAYRALGRASPRLGVRAGRCRRQGRRPQPAAATWHDQPQPTLGHRVQVPPGGARDPAQQHRGQHRSHRPRDTLRGPGAGRRGRVDGVAGDAAQRGPAGHERRPSR